MKKLIGIGFAAVLLVFGLAGCGSPSLSVNHHQLKPDGLAAVIKGQSRYKTINYQIDNGKQQTEKTHNHHFALTIPAQAASQKVTLSAGGSHQTVKIAKAAALTTYSDLQKKYNQAITASALSKTDQKKARYLQAQSAKLKQQQQAITKAVATAKKKLAAGNATAAKDLQAQAAKADRLKAQAAKLKATSSEVTKAMQQAQKRVKNRSLPATAQSGIHNLVTTSDVTIRTNTDQNQVIGIALMIPVSAMKDKARAKNFAVTFSILADSVGANAKKIMHDFQKQTKSNQTSKTTNQALHSNGVNFQVGYSTTTLYIYMTK